MRRSKACYRCAWWKLDGKPGARQELRYDALIDIFRNDSEFAELMYIRRLKGPAMMDTIEEEATGRPRTQLRLSAGGSSRVLGPTRVRRRTGGGSSPREQEELDEATENQCEAFYLLRLAMGMHYLDDVSGLVYMGTRWYDPDTRRFVSHDPSNPVGPDA